MSFRELLEAEFRPYGQLSPSQLELLEQHYNLLLHWNKRLNLTRITAEEDAVRLHYCESLFLARALPAGPLRVADLGSGAGFPGIPLAIYRPDCAVTLVESDQRKAVFLREASRALPTVKVLSARFESLQEPLDWVVSRAVTAGEVLSTHLAPNFALLGSLKDPISSADPIPLPWGKNHALLMGH